MNSKLKLIGLTALASTIFTVSVAHAITIKISHSSVNGNLCDLIGGGGAGTDWTGTGTAKPLWTCNYSGTAHIDAIPGTNTFKIHIDLPKGKGLICPAYTDDLNGTCDGDTIQIGDQSTDANFNGTLTQNASSGKLSADLTGNVVIDGRNAPVNPMHLDQK